MKVFNTSTTAWFFTIRLHFKKQYNATGKPFTRRKLRVFKNSRGTYHQFPKHLAFGSQSTAQICGWCPGSGLYSPWPSIKCKKFMSQIPLWSNWWSGCTFLFSSWLQESAVWHLSSLVNQISTWHFYNVLTLLAC